MLKDLPPRSTVIHYFCRWQDDGTLDRLHHALYVRCREQAERQASPTAAFIDSQSVKSAEKGGVGSIRQALMAARRSRARSGTSSSFQQGLARVCREVNVKIVRRCDIGRLPCCPGAVVERTIA